MTHKPLHTCHISRAIGNRQAAVIQYIFWKPFIYPYETKRAYFVYGKLLPQPHGGRHFARRCR